ncbi:MAG TPA: S41 family peptidase [Blastocatellia bacterium]|nr:S41 family peptidase [Blastocatellia bacterium]
MSIRSKLTLITVSALVAVLAVVGGMLSNSNSPLVRAIADPGPYPQIRIFEEVVRHIQNDYVEKPDLEKVRIGAMRGLTEGLDPWSAYLLPVQVKEYQANKNSADTTGIVLGLMSNFGYVITTIPNSPADKAGIKSGDVIEYIDGHATRDLDLYDMRSLLAGAPGSSVELSVFRNGRSEKIKISRGPVAIPAPELKSLDQQIGYVRVPVLSSGQSEAVGSAIRNAIKKGAQKIILDLRGSAGGDLKEGVAVANFFLKSGTISKTLGRGGKVLATYEARPEQIITDLPVAVIVDQTTAGAAEIVAAAIMENQRGDVVGSRTFGVGSEQELFPLQDGSAFLLTTARYASPSGRIFITDGVTPNNEVKRTELADVVTPDDNEDNQAQNKSGAPATSPSPAGSVAPAATPSATPKQAEDILLKKTIELLNSGKARKRAA